MRSAILLFIFLFHWVGIFSQNYSVNGYIEDARTGERLIGAMVYDSVSYSGTNSNSYGYFNIKCRKGSINLICSYIGYKTSRMSFSLTGDTTVNMLLQPKSFELAEVVINEKKRLIESSRMSVMELPMVTTLQKKLGEIRGLGDRIEVLQLAKEWIV